MGEDPTSQNVVVGPLRFRTCHERIVCTQVISAVVCWSVEWSRVVLKGARAWGLGRKGVPYVYATKQTRVL